MTWPQTSFFSFCYCYCELCWLYWASYCTVQYITSQYWKSRRKILGPNFEKPGVYRQKFPPVAHTRVTHTHYTAAVGSQHVNTCWSFFNKKLNHHVMEALGSIKSTFWLEYYKWKSVDGIAEKIIQCLLPFPWFLQWKAWSHSCSDLDTGQILICESSNSNQTQRSTVSCRCWSPRNPKLINGRFLAKLPNVPDRGV